jgi:hypothetical protein
MPVAFRDALDVEELGPAAFLAVEAEPDGRALRGALFLIDARGEPLEFVYNRVELPETFLWRRADLRRHAERRLAASLLTACPRTPRLLLTLADQVGSELFCEDLQADLPVGRIGHTDSASAYAPQEVLEPVERPVPLHLFWFPGRPDAGSLERQLFEHLRDRGLLLEPFERAEVGLDEAYGSSADGGRRTADDEA